MNVAQCRFRPAALQCSCEEKADGCLSPAQVGALDRAFAGPKDAAGYPVYVPVPYDTGIIFTGAGLPGYLPTGAPGVFGPATRALTIDIDARLRTIEADAAQRLTDTNVWTDLDTFLENGGKVLFFPRRQRSVVLGFRQLGLLAARRGNQRRGVHRGEPLLHEPRHDALRRRQRL